MGATSALLMTAFATQAAAGIVTSRREAKSQEAEGNYERQIAETNAMVSESQADDALSRGSEAQSRLRRGTSKLAGAQRAALAGQGVDVASGTSVDLLNETQQMSELDALTIGNNAWREAWGYRTQAADYRSQGRFAQITGRNRARMTLLTGGLTAARDLTTGAYLSSQASSGGSKTKKKPKDGEFPGEVTV